MRNCWKRRAFGLVAVLTGVVLLGAVSPICARPFPGDGVNGAELSYEDNGDGTTTDSNTKLVWEQKWSSDDPACAVEPPEMRNVHCVNRCTYTWTEAVTDFLDTLNNKCDGDGTTPCTRNRDCRDIGSGECGYAGRNDWRLPNIKELQSIVDYGTHTPPVDPTFPGATAVFPRDHVLPFYWSSTSQIDFPSNAWIIDFDYGTVTVWDKRGQHPQPNDNIYGFCVRAVRRGVYE